MKRLFDEAREPDSRKVNGFRPLEMRLFKEIKMVIFIRNTIPSGPWEEDGLLRIMTVRELSDYLRVHPSTVYRLVKLGRLPAFKVGDCWRFKLEEIDDWLDENREKHRLG